jgi:hypothetical protein
MLVPSIMLNPRSATMLDCSGDKVPRLKNSRGVGLDGYAVDQYLAVCVDAMSLPFSVKCYHVAFQLTRPRVCRISFYKFPTLNVYGKAPVGM